MPAGFRPLNLNPVRPIGLPKAKDFSRIPTDSSRTIMMNEGNAIAATIGQDPRDRFTSARLMLRGVLEVAVVEVK